MEGGRCELKKNVTANIVKVIKCRRLRLAGHIARMEEGGSAFKI